MGTLEYDTSEKRRTPSWTDRVLWCGEIGAAAISPLLYDACMHTLTSDHKPVKALFEYRAAAAAAVIRPSRASASARAALGERARAPSPATAAALGLTATSPAVAALFGIPMQRAGDTDSPPRISAVRVD